MNKKKDQIDRESYILGGVQYSLGSAQLSSAEKLSVTLNDGFSAPFFLNRTKRFRTCILFDQVANISSFFESRGQHLLELVICIFLQK